MISLPDRLFNKLMADPNSGCWLWTGALANGYGAAKIPKTRRQAPAHRTVYEHFNGPVPSHLVMDHKCRNRACCNPAHLRVTTHRENILCGEGVSAKAAAQTHCANGHSLGDAYLLRNGRHRKCRVCHKAADARYYDKHKNRINAKRRK